MAQEASSVYYAKKYIDLNMKSGHKFNERVQRQQKRLLRKLRNKESRVEKRLRKKDSVAYTAYKTDPLTYDSISRLQKPDSANLYGKTKNYRSASVDSLTRIKSFIEDKAHVTGESNSSPMNGYDSRLGEMKAKHGYNQYLTDLINKRTTNLKKLSHSTKGGIPGINKIDKNVFYSNEKIKVLTQIRNEPSGAEDKALEYLQGQDGFDKYLKGEPTGMAALAGKGMDATALEKMGYQTKRSMNVNLKNKLGNNTGAMQQRMSFDVQKWQDKTNKLATSKANAKQRVKQVKNTRNSLGQARGIDRLSFKVNPMKAQPFWRRIEKQYNWQTTRATLDGKPAIFQLSAMAGYKHTPKLTYGIGIAPSIGLGQNWSNIKLTFEGVGLRTFTEWKWVYGIGVYAGYERTYKLAAFDSKKAETNLVPNTHNTSIFSEAVVIGLTKSYSINEKWNGSVQVLYDIWWKDKGLRSPILIRFATIKK